MYSNIYPTPKDKVRISYTSFLVHVFKSIMISNMELENLSVFKKARKKITYLIQTNFLLQNSSIVVNHKM
jgi:hypothetical protein